MPKNARARRVRRRLIAGVALTTVVSAGSATAAVADAATPSTPASPGGPKSPITSPWTGPGTTPTPPPASTPSPSPSPSPTSKPTPPPSHPKAGAGHFDNALIATTALVYAGRWGGQACLDAHQYATGQCREFVDCVVYLATGGKIWPVDGGGSYQASFAAAGAVPVAAADAAEGDIIQIGDHDDSSPLHTAIVLENRGNGTFTVVDSNFVGWPTTPELVGVHDWTPPAGAQIWRLGAVTTAQHTADGRKTPAAGSTKGSGGATGSGIQDPATAALLAPPPAPSLSTGTVNGLASGVIAVRAADADPRHPSTHMRYWIDGKPADAAVTTAGTAQLQLDTTKLADGPHQLSAQAITASGAISVLTAPTTITVANHQLTVAVAAPNAPLLTGTVPLAVGAAPAGDLDKTTLTIDGVAAPSQPAAVTGALNVDTTTLTAGPHVVSVAVTNHEGQTATWGPVTITVTGAATGLRAVLPSATAGHQDLVAVDAAGRLVRYAWRADATFGTPEALAEGFGDVSTLVVGHFVGAAGDATQARGAQLLAVHKDGSAHVYGFDATGKLLDQGTITGPSWGTFTRLAVGRFTKSGGSSLVGIDKDGHAQLITVAADGKSAKTEGLSVDPELGGAATVITEARVGGTDRLLAVSASGAVSAFVFDAEHGFVKVKNDKSDKTDKAVKDAKDPKDAKSTTTGKSVADAKPEPLVQLPAPAAAPVLGTFGATGPQVLVTGTDGQTWVLSAAQPDQPSQGIVFNQHDAAPTAAPAVPAKPGQRRISVVPN
jgi:hypothetical protein